MHFLCVFLLFNQFLPSTSSVPGTVVGSGETAVNKMKQEAPHGAYDLGEGSGGEEMQ